ncbi:MAG: hypothetical protein H8E44_24625 [Planctomycetes bacterium]|nr:hypothetical protein [Planctomycetota bacterium]MBL7040014.1 hypothetical protein [Pirellulaceae bacterium]
MRTSSIAVLLIVTFVRGAGSEELDAYGGWTDIRGQATGAFHIETINGRYVLITPAGHGFVALGVNHLGAIKGNGPDEPDLFRTRYHNDWKEFNEELLRQYKDWGFNTVDDTVKSLRDARPYLASWNFVRTAKYYGKRGEENPCEFPDVFDPAVKTRLERVVEGFCKQHRESANLIAYYWTDTPTWDIHKTRRFRGTDWVSEIRRLPARSTGRQRYAEFLRQRYENDIARLNRAYDLHNESFGELQTTDFSMLDLTRYEVERDDQDFLGIIATTYYGIVGPAMRRHDPRHMVFGEKYLLGDVPPQVIKAASPHLDAIAIQPGDGYLPIYVPGDTYPAEEIEKLHQLSEKPIFICDHQISFATKRYPVSIWPYHQRDNEADAAAATERFLREAFARPYILGYMRCQYIDRFSTRRNASKLGLLRDDGTPYQELVDAMRRGNLSAKETVRDALLGRGDIQNGDAD